LRPAEGAPTESECPHPHLRRETLSKEQAAAHTRRPAVRAHAHSFQRFQVAAALHDRASHRTTKLRRVRPDDPCSPKPCLRRRLQRCSARLRGEELCERGEHRGHRLLGELAQVGE
jgi:hypothetical protein